MKISALEVDGFGVWSGLELANLSDELTVFYGVNEAGKTTLMQFVRTMFFGFSADRRTRYLPPLRTSLKGGPPLTGGSLKASDGGVNWTLTRRAEGPLSAGTLQIVDRDNQRHDDALFRLLADIDEPIFNNVFALGMREIQQLATLNDTEAARQLYDLTLGLDRVSLVDVMRSVDASRDRLLAADSRASLVTQLTADSERLQNEINELRAQGGKYLDLVQARDRLARDIERLETEAARLAGETRLVELARGLRDRWLSRADVQKQLRRLGCVEELPDDALHKLDRLNGRLAARQTRRMELQKTRDALQAEADRLVINDALCRHTPRLEALGEQQQWISSLGSQVKNLEAEILELDIGIGASHEQWGGAQKPKDFGKSSISPKAIANLRTQAKLLHEAHKSVRTAQEQLARNRESATNITAQLKSALGNRAQLGLTKELQRAGERVSQLRRRVQIDERLEQLSRRQVELEHQSREFLNRQLLPMWVVSGLGALVVLGAALIFAALLLPAAIVGSFAWPMAVFGLAGVAAGGATKWVVEHTASTQLESCQQQLDLLLQQAEQTKKERDLLDGQLPRGGGPLVSRLQTAEKDLSALEELLPQQGEREAAARAAKIAIDQKKSAKADYLKAQQRWRQILADSGFPPTLRPKQLREFHQQHETVRDLGRKLEQRREELGQRTLELAALTTRIEQLAVDVAAKPAKDDPLGVLRRLLSEHTEQQARLTRRQAIEEEIAALKRKQVFHSRAMDKLRARRKLLLHEAQAADEEEFRRKAQVQVDHKALQGRLAALSLEIEVALAGHSEDAVAELLDDQHDLIQYAAQLGADLETCKRDLLSRSEQRGELSQQLRSIAEDRRLATKQLELSQVERRLQDALERWRVLAVCSLVLEKVRARYERDRQPEALREASGYLQRLTGGRYVRVWTTLGHSVLRVDDAQGRTLDVELLSRGTREQLFLSLRLALVRAYALRGARLPLVLDDVLVNFDAVRTKAAAEVLCDFARGGQQILVFTCHEHIARLFKSLQGDVRVLPDNADPNSAVGRLADAEPAEPVRKPRRTRPEPVPVPPPAAKPAVEEVDELASAEVIVIDEGDLDPLASAALVVSQTIEAPPEVPREIVHRVDLPQPAAPPPPTRAPAPRRKQRRTERRVFRNDWSAEEFEGELADRVARPELREPFEEDSADRVGVGTTGQNGWSKRNGSRASDETHDGI